jgi:hypothetical protein
MTYNKYQILDMKRLTNTPNGGPRYSIVLSPQGADGGAPLKVITKSDAMYTYAISSAWVYKLILGEVRHGKKYNQLADATMVGA